MYFFSLFCMAFIVVVSLLFADSFGVGDLTQILIYLAGQAVLYVVFPTISLAHANSFIDPLVAIFSVASEDDFKMIGIDVITYIHTYLHTYILTLGRFKIVKSKS